jgi:hypothetical protein
MAAPEFYLPYLELLLTMAVVVVAVDITHPQVVMVVLVGAVMVVLELQVLPLHLLGHQTLAEGVAAVTNKVNLA